MNQLEVMKNALEALERKESAIAELKEAISEAEKQGSAAICPNCLGTKRPHAQQQRQKLPDAPF